MFFADVRRYGTSVMLNGSKHENNIPPLKNTYHPVFPALWPRGTFVLQPRLVGIRSSRSTSTFYLVCR